MSSIKYSVLIQAYENETPQGQVFDLTTLALVVTDPQDAVKRAKTLIKKKFYRIAQITEIMKEEGK